MRNTHASRTPPGNASQVSDGAAAVLLARRSVAKRLGLPIIGKFVHAAVVGVPPKIMGYAFVLHCCSTNVYHCFPPLLSHTHIPPISHPTLLIPYPPFPAASVRHTQYRAYSSKRVSSSPMSIFSRLTRRLRARWAFSLFMRSSFNVVSSF
jgi:hypothetical protein